MPTISQRSNAGEIPLKAEGVKIQFNKGALAGSIPLILIIVLGVVRQGFTVGLSAILAGLALAALIIAWIRLTHKVSLGPDYVRVRNGWKVTIFRRNPQLNSLRVSDTTGGRSILYLRQNERRARIDTLSSEQLSLVVERLGITPEVAMSYRGRLVKRGVSHEGYMTLPYWARHPWIIAIFIVIILLALIVPFAVYMVDKGNGNFRQAATINLQKAAAPFDTTPSWRPIHPADIHWENETDHSPLVWERGYEVAYGNGAAFVADWKRILGASSDPYCQQDTINPAGSIFCTATENVGKDSANPISMTGTFTPISAATGNVQVALTEDRQ